MKTTSVHSSNKSYINKQSLQVGNMIPILPLYRCQRTSPLKHVVLRDSQRVFYEECFVSVQQSSPLVVCYLMHLCSLFLILIIIVSLCAFFLLFALKRYEWIILLGMDYFLYFIWLAKEGICCQSIEIVKLSATSCIYWLLLYFSCYIILFLDILCLYQKFSTQLETFLK